MAKPGEITGIWIDEMIDYDHWTWKLCQSAPHRRMESASFQGFNFHIMPGLSDRAFVTAGGETFAIMGLNAARREGRPFAIEVDLSPPALTAVRCDRLSRQGAKNHG